ncbi:2-oxoacid:acceptor oxidoreductase family protein [Candidatus Bipolaricaulota sp. J31]
MDVREIVIAGVGGQGTVFAARILAHAALIAGHHVAQSASYGAEARGTPAWAGVVISSDPIVFPYPQHCDAVLALAAPGYRLWEDRLAPGAVVLAEEALGLPGIGVPAARLARELDAPQAANLVLLGALLGYTGWLARDVAAEAVAALSPERFRAGNLAALEAGWRYGRSIA